MNAHVPYRWILALAVAGLMAVSAGCGTTAPNIESQEELAEAMSEEGGVVVFGRVRWIKNGEELEIGGGILGNLVELHVYPAGSDDQIIASVGAGGQFSWVLQPGVYRIPMISFIHRMNSYLGVSFIRFTVPAEGQASYAGTLTIETSYETGWLGAKMSIDRFSVAEECEADCGAMLAQLGLPDDAAEVGLMEFDPEMLERWRKATEKD